MPPRDVLIYWAVVYYVARKWFYVARKWFGFSRDWAAPLAAGICICGVSAALAAINPLFPAAL